jgi:flavin reductase (DIM6/NTAB) family NADH-FMN oxidoreductase RutF
MTDTRRPVPLSKCYRLLNHGPTVLVTSAHGDRRNVMAAAWNMALDFEPPKVAVVIDKNTFTRRLVEASGEFTLNLPCRAQAAATLGVGNASGRELPDDKFAHFGLGTLPASLVGAPLIEGCVGWLECRVIPEAHTQQRYDLFIGEVVAAWADARVFADGHWRYDDRTDPALRTLHYVAGGHFFATGEAFEVPMLG